MERPARCSSSHASFSAVVLWTCGSRCRPCAEPNGRQRLDSRDGGVDRSTIWPYDERGEPREFYYSRYGHPTGAAAEERLGELEGGEALLYASGMAAETAVLLALARPGTTVALAEGAYFGTSVLFRELARWGARASSSSTRPGRRRRRRHRLGRVAREPRADGARLGRAARASRPVVCDATVSTPVYLRALDEGADVVVHSATKFLTGSHDALLGATVTRDPEQTERLRDDPQPDRASSRRRTRRPRCCAGSTRSSAACGGSPTTATELARRLDDAPGGRARPLPGLLGADLVRRRRSARGRDAHAS